MTETHVIQVLLEQALPLLDGAPPQQRIRVEIGAFPGSWHAAEQVLLQALGLAMQRRIQQEQLALQHVQIPLGHLGNGFSGKG